MITREEVLRKVRASENSRGAQYFNLMLGDDGGVYFAAYSGMGEYLARSLPRQTATIVRRLIRDGELVPVRAMRRTELLAEFRREGNATLEVCLGTIRGCRLLTRQKARAMRREIERLENRPENQPERIVRITSKAVAKAACLLDLSPSELASVLGVGSRTAARLFEQRWCLTQGTQPWIRGVLLVRLWSALNALVGGRDEDARGWLRSKTKGIPSKSPLEHLQTLSGVREVVRYLEANI